MKKEKIDHSIVCDTLGCGNLAVKKLTFSRTGTSILLCDKCLNELAGALAKETKNEKASK